MLPKLGSNLRKTESVELFSSSSSFGLIVNKSHPANSLTSPANNSNCKVK